MLSLSRNISFLFWTNFPIPNQNYCAFSLSVLDCCSSVNEHPLWCQHPCMRWFVVVKKYFKMSTVGVIWWLLFSWSNLECYLLLFCLGAASKKISTIHLDLVKKKKKVVFNVLCGLLHFCKLYVFFFYHRRNQEEIKAFKNSLHALHEKSSNREGWQSAK